MLGRLEEPDEEEFEDSFLRYAGDVKASRREATAWHLSGTPEPDGFKDLVTMMVPADALRECAKRFGVTVTELLCAPGNGGIARVARCIPEVKATDVEGIVRLSKEEHVDFVVVTPDDPLALGCVDRLEAAVTTGACLGGVTAALLAWPVMPPEVTLDAVVRRALAQLVVGGER